MITLQKILQLAIPYASRDVARLNINGIHFICTIDSLTAIASDGYALIKIESRGLESITALPSGTFTLNLVQCKSLEKILKLLPDYKILTLDKINFNLAFPDIQRVISTRVGDATIDSIPMDFYCLKMLCQTGIDFRNLDATCTYNQSFLGQGEQVQFYMTSDVLQTKITTIIMPRRC